MKTKILSILYLAILPFMAVAQGTTNVADIAASLTELETDITKHDTHIDWGKFCAFFLACPIPPAEATLRKRWFTLSIRYANQLRPPVIVTKQGGKVIFTESEIQHDVGRLGLPFETMATIEGVRAEKGKVGTRTLIVDVVNGIKAEKPITIWIDNLEHPGLPEAKRCVLKGYEIGKWIGENPNQQACWQFFHEFVVTEVIEPTTLKIEKESQPTLGNGGTRAR